MTSIALVSTTIHVPHVLAEYRRIGPDVEIIVAGDVNGPQDEIAAFCRQLDARYLGPQEQEALGYACSPIIGWKSIQRRSIAILEAIRSGADIIISLDTDNAPTDNLYFRVIDDVMTKGTRGLGYSIPTGWLNPGRFADPPYVARGFPLSQRHNQPDGLAGIEPPNGRYPIGILQSLVLGDPDIDAIERIAKAPTVDGYRMNGRATFVTNPRDTWAPTNSQATAWRRELAPLMLCPPGLGRFDDIWGSYIAQRVLQETGYHVAFGWPFVRQDRHDHNLLKDLEQELWGMRHTERFVSDLKAAYIGSLSGNSILGKLHVLISDMTAWDYLPQQTRDFLVAWVQDVERVL